MRGPHWEVSSGPGPTVTAAMRAVSPSTKASWTSVWTKNRLAAVHACPPLRIFATMAPSTAAVDVGVGEDDERGVAARAPSRT